MDHCNNLNKSILRKEERKAGRKGGRKGNKEGWEQGRKGEEEGRGRERRRKEGIPKRNKTLRRKANENISESKFTVGE